jgi:hypothetical protein
MDGTGTFSGQNDAEAVGIDTPLAIGNDERRMHVRAYNYWVSLLDGRAYPSIEDLIPENLEDFGPNSVLLDFTAGIDDPNIAYLGAKLRTACELPVGVTSVAEVPSRSLLSRLTDHYMQIIANRAPIGFEAEFCNDAGNDIMYRGILMPFSSDDDTIDFIYGVINWKEGADAALAVSLTNEVERALNNAPVPRVAPSAAIWADGPSAHGEDAQETELLLGSQFSHDASDEDDDVIGFVPDGNESLADWLAAARSSAEVASHSDARSRAALYRALGQAYDFALTAVERPDEYQELMIESNLVAQPRAPMTPIVKLVFGIGYDKTRLAEYALALTHGQRANVSRGGLQNFVETYAGGLKGIVQAERSLRRPSKVETGDSRAIERARSISPKGIVEMQGDEEFVVLVARRIDGAHVAVLGQVASDSKYIERALKKLSQ